MKKKVQIVTFPWTINYGGVLQAYALEERVKDLGFEVSLLNYYNDDEITGRMSAKRRLLHRIWTPIDRVLFGGRKRSLLTDRFRGELMQLSQPRCTDMAGVIRASEDVDIFITGSDQVWNADLTGNPAVYLLDQAGDRTRIAYAASFGKPSLNERYHALYREALSKFAAVSVREDSGADIVKAVSGREAEVVVDPVFLLPRDKWMAVAERSETVVEGDYILCYYMPSPDHAVTDAIRAAAAELAGKQGMKVVNIGKKGYEKLRFWETNLTAVGPAEFVWLVSHAKVVVTNSFHGTAFSLIMNVPVIVPVNRGIPERERLSARLEWILKMVGAEDRMVDCRAMDMARIDAMMRYDFTGVNAILSEKIRESGAWLEAQLTE